MSRAAFTDAAFLKEQRRFRRLEVALPVWLAPQAAVEAGQEVAQEAWELGYTRDISLGGAKVVVPSGEETAWRRAAREGTFFLVHFDDDTPRGDLDRRAEAIPAWVRHVERDARGQLALGVQFDASQAQSARETVLRRGFATLKARRRWQGAFGITAVLALVALWGVNALRADIAARDARIAALQKQQDVARAELQRLSRPALASTKSAGIDREFARREVQARLEDLQANMARLNDPSNMDAAIRERKKAAQSLGISLQPAARSARVQFAVAFPYGYNWPLVVSDFEKALNRRVPHIVVFQDWSAPFPDLDAREARARGKTLQITWEPWHFSNPNAIKLRDIAAGKHDAYIDSWAAGARSFGGELWIRWGHEMNGNWYPWSIGPSGGDPKVWVAAYRRIHDRFRRAGASNVRWIWCFNAESVPDVAWNDPAKTYPGDAYVDAVAVDGYNFGSTTAHSRWQSFEQIFARPLARAQKNWPQKPLWIAETGCATEGGDKVRWLKEMDQTLRSRFARVESVTWFEAAKEADWRLLSSPESAAAARKIWGSSYYRRGE